MEGEEREAHLHANLSNSDPVVGELRKIGILTYRWSICQRCREGYWELPTSKKRTCRRCRLDRPNNLE